MIEIDSLIDENLQDAIEQATTSVNFPWFFHQGTVNESNYENEKDYVLKQGINPHQFVHNIIVNEELNSHYYNLVEPLLLKIAQTLKTDIMVEKAKFNFLPRNFDDTHHYPHVDISENKKEDTQTLIYYVNNSDGDTCIFDQYAPRTTDKFNVVQRITPKKGKAIIFDSNQFHSSSSPVNSENRIVLNVVFNKVK